MARLNEPRVCRRVCESVASTLVVGRVHGGKPRRCRHGRGKAVRWKARKEKALAMDRARSRVVVTARRARSAKAVTLQRAVGLGAAPSARSNDKKLACA